MVLWVLAILMVIVLSFSFMARTETHATLAFKERMEMKFLAEAAIQRGIQEIYYLKQNPQLALLEESDVWKTDGTAYSGRLGERDYEVSITDEAGKININALNDTSGIILKTLLTQMGVQDEDADTIVDSILDWKDADDLTRLHGAESDYYMSLPNPYKAKNANFDTLEELLLVKGVTYEIFFGSEGKKGLVNFITVNSNTNAININAAPKEVLMAIPGITPEIADAIISSRQNKRIMNLQEVGIPAQSTPYISFADSNTYSVEGRGYAGEKTKGYPIKAVVTLEPTKYKYLYYKSPAAASQ
ncbi:MAG TPA: helix-hairpin-helix domain-containing protein [Thermodesulfovibrionales bacterium]|nr:helix-hairpin-helix domain-containing protein [Thermodesulfovibrionales bacterium]